MSRLSLVIFGATGYTGKHAVKELARICRKESGVTWGIAGRSREKLEKILQDVSEVTGDDLSSVRIIIADVSDEKSLRAMCGQAGVLVNCCGPYRQYGEPVVRAAIDSNTHYIDVAAEPQFMHRMKLDYDKAARDAGVYIVCACGYDCIPSDMGVVFLEQNFGGTLNSVEAYLSVSGLLQDKSRGSINYGTWESLVHAVSHFNELPGIWRKLFPERLPKFSPKLKARFLLHKKGDSWCLPFLSADTSIVYRTQRHLYETERKRPVKIKAYYKLPSFFIALGVAFACVIFFILTQCSCMRKLLLNYPNWFSLGMISKEGPTEETMNNTLFQFELIGRGWEPGSAVDTTAPNKKVVAKISGRNPAYGATVVALLCSALTIIKENDKMPAHGVLTPGVAFRSTNIIQHLCENDIKFEILNK